VNVNRFIGNRAGWRGALAAALAGGVALSAATASAQALRPNILIIYDTSGSMVDHDRTGPCFFKDGSPLCGNVGDGVAGNDLNNAGCSENDFPRRMFALKRALRDTLAQVGTDEANFGLQRFAMRENAMQSATCPTGHYFQDGTTAVTVSGEDRTGCRMSTHDKAAPQEAYGSWFDGGLKQVLLVPVTADLPGGGKPRAQDFDPPGANIESIYKWIDLGEAAQGNTITDPELRGGNGFYTMLGRSLFYARMYFDNYIKPTDPKAACRKNIVILVTDGAETCDSTGAFAPHTQAASLYASGVETYVVTDRTTGNANNNIAYFGSGTKRPQAIQVDLSDTSAVKSALIGIIAEAVPPIEICNGVDDNCNNQIDEPPLPGVGGQCLCSGLAPENIGKGMCKAGTNVCRGSNGVRCEGCVVPGTEVCNGLDDNCNGQVDEGFDLGAACTNGLQGACLRTGNKVCSPDGSTTICDAPTVVGTTEICNNVDDNCDGMTDEGTLPGVGENCGINIGQCVAGKFKCESGRLVCDQMNTMGVPEICDGLDNNCNGQTDEGFPIDECACAPHSLETLKMGECKPGKRICKGALGFLCEGCVPPRTEVCDGKDNNCDGMIDEGEDLCIAGRICLEAECQLLCGDGEFPCPIGYECQKKVHPTKGEQRICVSTKCREVSCMPGFECNPANGVCVDPCAGVMCNEPQQCFSGECRDCRTKPDLCRADQLCREGRCVEDPCKAVTCQTNQYCDNGECINLCTDTCAAGQRCIRGVCQGDACAGVSCADGTICNPNTAECKSNQCLLRVCPGQKCVPLTGACIDDPCKSVRCPADKCLKCEITPDGAPSCVVDRECQNVVDEVTVTRQIRTGGAGCSCRVPGDPRGTDGAPDGALIVLVALGAAAVWRRRRKS
jgi:MYXO-CTERM domain-containing protein